MGFTLLHYRIWIRKVCWLAPPAPKELGTDSTNTSRIQMLLATYFDVYFVLLTITYCRYQDHNPWRIEQGLEKMRSAYTVVHGSEPDFTVRRGVPVLLGAGTHAHAHARHGKQHTRARTRAG